MKKSLLALAALSAIAGTAQAQSSVTLFGALDAGAYFVNGATSSTNNAYGIAGNTIVSSSWGLKGTEDLGGGMKANFYLESGIDPRNGLLSQAAGQGAYIAHEAGKNVPTTLFDRGSYVGVQGNWGQLNLGNKVNPFFASSGAIAPVSGNSVSTNAAGALGYATSTFTHNAITYTLPTMSGFNAEIQWGAGNAPSTNTGGAVGGSVMAGSLSYDIGALNLRAAGQKRWGNGSVIAANPGTPTVGSDNVGSYLLGAKYTIGAATVGAGWISNQVKAGSGIAATNTNTYINNAFEVGVGYQATPAVLLGLTWLGATSGSNLINAQARYAFSKRTQAYAQLGMAINKNGLDGAGLGNFYALSGSNAATFGTGTAVTSYNFNQTAVGVGLIHTF